MFNKFRKAIAQRIYLGNPGFNGYDDSAKECTRLHKVELENLLLEIENLKFDPEKIKELLKERIALCDDQKGKSKETLKEE